MADEAGNLSYKEQQELFVSNHNGTSLWEVSMATSSAPLSVLLRACVMLVLFSSVTSTSFSKSGFIILLDYMTLIMPVLSCFTILADELYSSMVTMATIACGLVVMATIFRSSWSIKHMSPSNLMQARMSGRQPFICNFRAYVLIATAISILAVDFHIFPRRFAKAETYGSGLMDIGVGAFVFSNAVVSREARQGYKTGENIVKSLFQSIKSGSPLLVLGIGRCLAVKSTDYQEHVSEYGTHWNFFFTLFVVRVLSTIFVGFISQSQAYGITGLLLAVLYQYCLSYTGLRQFALHGSHGDDSRLTLLEANREGIVSCVGYLALYLMALQLGKFLFLKRDTFASWLKAFVMLVTVDAVFWGLTLACDQYVSPVSRRLANLTYIFWQMAFNVHLLLCFLLVDLAMTAVQKMLHAKSSPPGGCDLCYPNYTHPDLKREAIRTPHCICLIAAINRNQLVYFLLANLLTGAVNFSVKTLYCDKEKSFSIVSGYMFVLGLFILLLHRCHITLRVH